MSKGKRMAGEFISDLLNAPVSPQPSAKAFSFSDLLVDSKSNKTKNQVRVIIPPAIIRKPKNVQPVTVFQANIPKPIELQDEDGEKWRLRCFCDIKTDLGTMVFCEKCQCWQHAKCVNEATNRENDHYICPICAQKHIRCSCEKNLDYSVPLIQCTKCKYYVHRQCAGLGIGPCDPSTFVCKKCGGTPQQLADVNLPENLNIPNPKINLTKTMVKKLHPVITETPFFDVLIGKLVKKDLTLFQFCTQIYNSFRPFIYMVHPLCSFQTIKKRRTDVAISFYKCLFFIAGKLFDVEKEVVVSLLNILAQIDLYKVSTFTNSLYPSVFNPLTISDNAQPEFSKLKHLPDIKDLKLPNDLVITPNGVICNTELKPEQLICVLSGFIGLCDEFSYDKGIENTQMVIHNTKFIIDLTGIPQLALNFRRSLNPNCILKFFVFRGEVHVGLFAGTADVNGVDPRTRRERFAISANTELTLPIDFPPGILEEPVDYMNWHFEVVEHTPTPPSSPPQSPPMSPVKEAPKRGRAAREYKKEKPEKEKPKKKETKGRGGRRKGRCVVEVDPNDTFMFNLFKKDDAGEPIIQVYAAYNEEEEEEIYDEEEEKNEMNEEEDNSEMDEELENSVKDFQNVVITDTPVDLSFLDEKRDVGDCSFSYFKICDPTKEFLSVIH